MDTLARAYDRIIELCEAPITKLEREAGIYTILKEALDEEYDEALAARFTTPDGSIDSLRAEAASIYMGFRLISLNGTICSIPDTGLDTPPHRRWCRGCQAKWKRLKALGGLA